VQGRCQYRQINTYSASCTLLVCNAKVRRSFKCLMERQKHAQLATKPFTEVTAMTRRRVEFDVCMSIIYRVLERNSISVTMLISIKYCNKILSDFFQKIIFNNYMEALKPLYMNS
jgi:hypothetical protein